MKSNQTLTDIGEYALIERIFSRLGDVAFNVGDDAGYIKLPGYSKFLLVRAENFVEGIHFDLSYMGAFDVGWRVVVGSVSDIIAMGGLPKYILVTTGLPPSLKLSIFDELIEGIRECCKTISLKVCGGDLSNSRVIFITVNVIGEVEPEHMKLRSGAEVGQKIYVTGALGEAACGLQLLKENRWSEFDQLCMRFKRPTVRHYEIQRLKYYAKAMIDISDGLGNDILRLARASGVGVRIYEDKLPISEKLRQAAVVLNKTPLEFVLWGGEDYELIFTCQEEIPNDINATQIGEITEANYELIREDGSVYKLFYGGYQHFT